MSANSAAGYERVGADPSHTVSLLGSETLDWSAIAHMFLCHKNSRGDTRMQNEKKWEAALPPTDSSVGLRAGISVNTKMEGGRLTRHEADRAARGLYRGPILVRKTG